MGLRLKTCTATGQSIWFVTRSELGRIQTLGYPG